jgi:hypothetical protein
MKMPMNSGATGSMSPVKGVAGNGMSYRGGETGGMNAKTKDVEYGTNKGPMNVGKHSVEGGRRSHEHAMPGHRVHDEHLKTSAHSKTHMSHAVEHLRKEHKHEYKK